MRIIHKDEFASTIANGTVLVDFFATWCGPCKMLSPVLEEVANELGDTVTIVKVDVDEDGELAAQYGIMSVPTMMIFKDGQAVRQIQGFQSKPQIIAALQAVNNS